jgi:hypothetical protein
VGFGPEFEKFQEAIDLQKAGIAASFPLGGSVWEFFQRNSSDEAKAQISRAADQYFQSQKGASNAAADFICGINGAGSFHG